MPSSNPGFIKRNLVAIVMIPSIILVHYGWTKLQENELIVDQSTRKQGNPAVEAPRAVLGFLFGKKHDEENVTQKAPEVAPK